MIRQERRQQLAVALLVAIAIAIASFGATITGNTTSPPSRAGSASHELMLFANSGPLADQVDAAQQRFGRVDVTLFQFEVFANASTVELLLSDVRPQGVFGQRRLTLVRGRMPAAVGEVGLNRPALRALGHDLGDELAIGETRRVVTAEVEAPKLLNGAVAVVGPGLVPEPSVAEVLIDAPNAEVETFQTDLEPKLVQATSFAEVERSRALETVYVVALSTVGMVEVGLLCSAGFAVMARRRLREFGLLAAVGARERQLRLAMTLNGATLGLVGGAAGLAAGYALSVAARPWIEQRFGYRLDRWAVPSFAVVPFVVLATVTAALAAWWPARTLSKVPVTEALSARRPQPRPVHRTALWGLVAAVAGAAGWYQGVHIENAALAAPSLVVALVGILAVTPAAIAWLGRVSGRLPLALRVAGRDLARNQARSAATLAALVVAFGLPLGVAVSGTAVDARASKEPLNVPESKMLVWHSLPRSRFVPPPSSFDPASVTADLDALVAEVPGATLVPIAMAFDPSVPTSQTTSLTGEVVAQSDVLRVHRQLASPLDRNREYPEPVFVATRELLAAWGLDVALADSDADLLGPAHVGLGIGNLVETPVAATVENVDLPVYGALAPYWVPQGRLAERGLVARTVAWLLTSPAPLTADQRELARRATGDTLVIETTRAKESTASIRLVTGVGGSVVALSVLAISLALLRSETGEERLVLAAVGAPLRTRRRITAATAALLAGAGAVLAVPTGYLALLGLLGNPTAGYGFVVPWATLAAVLFGTPLLATAGAWLFGGTRRTSPT